ncbi:Uncharacterised protein [Mycobacteroides abscessus subsp. massiliense]|nr:Uncharacterised protein [Mycobacteroides abscessus subsp. massiliense]SKH92711.1 Uncharacterised protein [Mycobacteroides abscessus subsp. massiliense]SKI13203.1 Uncharacterised protein [Mycobacteroides abscessus subsp. massiliense]SKJ98692.1 Uncharacterised protein [Mycobacteroides abscessus subsp. massiliense]SKK28803.1 Uncharacterised protein [Mycobacteroides abscessus subsp. massiliense]
METSQAWLDITVALPLYIFVSWSHSRCHSVLTQHVLDGFAPGRVLTCRLEN